MLRRLMLFCALGVTVAGLAACGAPAPEPPPVVEEAPPPPPPTVYELTEVDIVTEAPDFTSRNVSVFGFKVGDNTNDASAALGDIVNTRTAPEDYITAYRNGGLVVYTFRLTGRARRIEVTSLARDQIASPRLSAWLTSGNIAQVREFMGEERGIEEVPDENATHYVYDDRGIRFITYNVGGQTVRAVRFSEFR